MDVGVGLPMHALGPEELHEFTAAQGDAVRGMLPVRDTHSEPASEGDDDPAGFFGAPNHDRHVVMRPPYDLGQRQTHRGDVHVNLCRRRDELRERVAVALHRVLHGNQGTLVIVFAAGDGGELGEQGGGRGRWRGRHAVYFTFQERDGMMRAGTLPVTEARCKSAIG